MSKFKIGDKVRTSIKLAEKHGDVYGIGAEFWEDSKTRKVLAVYDDDPARTDYKLSGTCFFWPEYALVSAEPREFIVIRRDKSDVIASHKRGDEIVKTAKATCAPSDEFNFETGAKLAFDRLMGREEPSACKDGFLASDGQCTSREGSDAPIYRFQCIREKCRAHRDYKEPAPQPAPRFKVGDRVVHSLFGAGVVNSTRLWSGMTIYSIGLESGATWDAIEANLSPAPEPKYYSGKVFAVRTLDIGSKYPERIARNGRVFEIRNGTFVENVAQYKMENCGIPYKSFADFCARVCLTEWAEVKE